MMIFTETTLADGMNSAVLSAGAFFGIYSTERGATG